MIVRAVLEHPELIEDFDWFNDGKDTINWLRWDKTAVADALADRMEVQLQLYHERWAKERSPVKEETREQVLRRLLRNL